MDTMLTLMQIAALAVAGMCLALLGSIKLPLARKLEIDEARVGGLVSVFGFTLIPMVLAAGFLVDWLGKQAVLGGGFVLAIFSLVMLSHARQYITAFVAVLVLGTGWSALVNVLNVTSPPAFVPPEDLPERTFFAMQIGDFIFGMGTFVTPLIIISCAQRFGMLKTLYGFAAAAVIPLLLGLGVDWEALRVSSAESVMGGLTKLLSDPIVWICCFAFFFHVPTEASIATWATTLLTNKGVKESRAASLLSAFWLTFMGSRLLAAFTVPHEAETTLLVTLAGFSVAITLGIVSCRGAGWMSVLIVMAGAVVGPIFPTLIAILYTQVPEDLRGRAVGVFFCIGGVGWTTIPILIGMYAQRTTVQRSFLIATGSAVLLGVLSLLLALRLQ